MAEVAHGLEKITNLQRPAYSGSDNVHQPKQPYLGSDNQPHGSERQQRGSDKQLRGSDKQIHGSDKQLHGSDKQPYGSDKQQHGIDKQQQHQDSKKKSGRPNVRKSNDYFSVSAESSHAVHRTQSRRQKNKLKPARKSSNRSHKKA
uniref:Uncharacterized protein n=1 Tax=Panagrolaimus davidi TaxID=227884 RepID=A0A914QKW4_9BILA